MTKLRSSSHTLGVERGRYTKPKTNICERLCPVCNVIEDEIHFLANSKLYDAERTHFFGKVTAKIQNLHELNDADKYIEAISDCRYRIAMTKLRSSSHTLGVERGRYTKPKTNICERLCPVCNVIEDEIHFLANSKLYDAERTHFFGKVTAENTKSTRT